jgi:hypothetical protein
MSDKRAKTNDNDAKKDGGSKQADYCLGVDPNGLGTEGGREYGRHIGTGEAPDERLGHPSAQREKKR